MDKTQIPNKKSQNTKLQYQRELKGWSQEYVAEKTGTTAKNVSRWECGDKPVPYYRQKLMNLFGAKDAAELGFIDQEELADEQAHLREETSLSTHPHSAPSLFVIPDHPAAYVVSLEESMLVLPSSTMSMTSMAPVDCGIWFSEKVVRIVGIVNQWRGRAVLCADLQQMLDLELRMFDEINALYDPDEYRLSRRNALIVIAALPKSLLGIVQQSQRAWQIQEEFLPSCAASLNACWQLMNGREIAAVEHAISQYLPVLITWARQPSLYQQTAAYLASQGCLLLGLVSLHLFPSPKNYQGRLAYCKQAVEYARISNNPAQLAIALIHLGGSFYDSEQLTEMLQANQEAVLSSKHAEGSPLLQSKALAELARASSRFNEVQDSLSYLQEARTLLPEQISSPPSYLPDSGLFHHILLEGQTFVNLGTHNPEKKYHKQAWKSLEAIENLPPAVVVPERFRIEAMNQRAFTAIHVGNLDHFCNFFIEGATGAKVLNSETRRQEVIANWKEARKMWPHEPRVIQLADAFV